MRTRCLSHCDQKLVRALSRLYVSSIKTRERSPKLVADAYNEPELIDFETYGFSEVGVQEAEGSALRYRVKRDSKDYLLYYFEDENLCQRAKFFCKQLSPLLFVIPEIQDEDTHWFLIDAVGMNAKTFFDDEHHTAENRLHIKYALEMGRFLRKLHNCPAPVRFGDPISESRDHSWLTFNGYVASKLERFLEEVRKQSFTDEAVGTVKNAIADLRNQLASFHPRTPPTWNHRRPSAEHVWFHPETAEIVAITGFEYSVFLPPELDIAYFLYIDDIGFDEALIHALYKGYGSARTMDVQRRERFYRRLAALDAIMKDSGPTSLGTEDLFQIISSK